MVHLISLVFNVLIDYVIANYYLIKKTAVHGIKTIIIIILLDEFLF